MRIFSGRRTLTLASAAIAIALLVPGTAGADVFDGLEPPTPDPVESGAVTSGPTISSDQADYEPNSGVMLTGQGWQPGESVRIVVTDDGLQPELPWQRDVTVVADQDGNVVDQFDLPEWVVATYFVTATGEASGTVSTSFTDSHTERGCDITGSTLTVTTTTDEFSASDNNLCSLREAVVAGNSDAGHTEVTAISVPAGTYTFILSGSDDNAAQGDLDVREDLAITGAGTGSTIIEAGSTNANGTDRVFEVLIDGTDLDLNDLTVRHGRIGSSGGGIRLTNGALANQITLDLTNVLVTQNTVTNGNGGGVFIAGANNTVNLTNSDVSSNTGNCAGCDGGGISNAGTLNITNGSAVDDNSSFNNGGGIFNTAGDIVLDESTVDDNDSVTGTFANANGEGGGVFQTNASASLIVQGGSSISDNTAPEDGGGIYLSNGKVTLSDGAAMSGNDAGRHGGGVFSTTGLDNPPGLEITDTTISGNTAGGITAGGSGGGVYNENNNSNERLRILRSTISGNTANGNGGGVRTLGIAKLANVTITNNVAGLAAGTGSGGGLFAQTRAVDLYNVTVSHNAADSGDGLFRGGGTSDAGVINLSNTIVANNDDSPGSAQNCNSSDPPVGNDIVNVTNNLDTGTTCAFGAAFGSQSGATADLGPLQNNGGPTDTRALGSNSDATDAGSNTVCANTFVANLDQRSVARPQPTGGQCDIGAYESDAQTTITVDKDFSDNGSGEVTITLTCESGTVTNVDNTATESDDAEFTVTGFTPGDTCDASEGTAPTGYSKNESDCQDLVLGTDTSCQIVNTTTSTITVDKDFSDNGSGEVTVTLTCDSGTVTNTDNTATESDDAEFKVDGFTPGDTCDASEGTAPTGYSKNESDCQDLVLGTDTSCQIVNTTTTTITVDKDFSDDGNGAVTITLTCESGTVTDTDNTATESDDAEFKVDGFTPGDTCDASEGAAPTGYSKNESDCQDLVLGTDASCQIVNTTTTTITVDKDFSDDGGGVVTITLTCESGTVTDTDNTAAESDDAEFKVDGFTPGDTCDASEGPAPAGYSKNESDCEDLVLGTDTSCQIVNTTTTTITVDKDFSDDGSGEVTVTLTCESGTVTDTDNTATESDDAEFKVDGFTPGDTCDASEGAAPGGYSKNESDCEDLVLGTDTSCQIVNTTTTTITVDKDFSDDGNGVVTIALTCESGTVTDTDNTATESDDAEFKVDGFTPGDTCDASEGSAPAGYSKNESDCEDLVLGTDTSCQIVNTTTTTITVDKDFSDDGTGTVTVALTCESGTVTDTDNTATESDDAEFKVDGFTPGDTCDASEGSAPAGYSKNESDCEDLVLGTDTSCQIVNTTTTTITVDKDFSDDDDGEVTITLTCDSGDVTETDNTATESDDAEFKVDGFTPGDKCDASEGPAPTGYTKNESDCEDLVLGTDTSCQIVNTLNETTITVDKDFSDDDDGEVTVALTCDSGAVTDTDNTATETDDAEFTVKGFTPGDECDASEGSAPAGYSKNESDCEDLVLGTDTSCQIVNTTTSTITVDKDFSDDGNGEVTVTLTCESGDVTETDNTATESDDAEFKVDGFTPGDTCDASEGSAPAGYTKNESDCEDLVLGTDTSCQIVNTTTSTITVDKDFSDNDDGEVTVTLTCESGDVTETDNTATETDDAEFKVDGFTPGDTCDASEGAAPAGYSKNESDCEDLVLGTDTSCKIVNTLNSANITVSKQYSDSNTSAVSVTLTCESGNIGGSNPRNVAPGSPQTFNVTGFNTGDTCDASESPVPPGYAQDNTDCQNVTLGTKTACTINNVTALTMVTQGGCTFDRNTSRNLRQFPLIYTPDGSASGHKLNASNPGQFFMNAAYGGSASSIQLKIPYPFVTVGTNPVKVYDGVTTTNASKTCFAPDNLVRSQTNQITWNWNTDSFASAPQTINVTMPSGGFAYVRLHLAYGLKGVAGNCAKTGTTEPFTASCSSPAVTIAGYKTYQFAFTGGAVTPTDTIESYNIFKKNPGIGGLVLQNGTTAPIANTKVEIWQNNKKMADLSTDEDGWYMWSYKYTGKAASFNVKLPAYGLQQSVTLKSNGYLSVPFTTP